MSIPKSLSTIEKKSNIEIKKILKANTGKTEKTEKDIQKKPRKRNYVPRGVNGGKREGSGRKAGVMSETLEEYKVRKAEVKRIVNGIIFNNAQSILGYQIQLAKGISYLYCDKVLTRNKNGQPIKREKVIVKDPDVIQQYLNGELEDLGCEEDYYFIVTEKPDNNAIKDLLNRALDTPAQSFKVPEDEDPDGESKGFTVGIIKFDN